MDGSRVVRREFQRQPGHGRDRTGEPDERASLLDRHHLPDPVDRRPDVSLHGPHLIRSGRVVGEVPLGEADAADVHAQRRRYASLWARVGAEHHLGRAATDVRDENRR